MSNQLELSKKVVPIASNVTLTGSWVAGTLAGVDTQNYVGLLIKYTKGTETGIQIKVEGSLDISLGLATTGATCTNFFQRVVESTTNGTTTLTQDLFEITASGNYAEVISPFKADVLKISAQADTIGGGPGTYSIWAVLSWV